VKAIRQILPEWKLVSCWNHILTDVEVWLKKRQVTVQEIAVYKSTIRELLSCQTSEEFTKKFTTFSISWSEVFKEYYDCFLFQRMEMACLYYLQFIGASVDSVTNNISESFNSVLKRRQDWEEVTVDAMVLVLYQLQNVYVTQIKRSLLGFGPFTVDKAKGCGMFLTCGYLTTYISEYFKSLAP
jgi:hypothetical protein